MPERKSWAVMGNKPLKGFSELEQVLGKRNGSPQPVKQPTPSKVKVSAKVDTEDAQEFLQAMQGVVRTSKDDSISEDGLFAAKLADLGLAPKEESKNSKKVFGKNSRGKKSSSQIQGAGLSITQPMKDALPGEPDTLQDNENAAQLWQSHMNPQAAPQAGQKPMEDEMFFKAVQGVKPMQARGRDIPKPAPAKTVSPMVASDALADLLLGKIEFDVRNTDEYVEGFVVGLDPLVLEKLRNGGYSPEAHLDLHGQNSLQAQDSLMIFIKNAYHRNMRTLLVITGRGKNSPNGQGVIRADLQEWLTHEPFKRVVLGFCSARPCDGGAGAVYILLRKFKKSSGKIRWERAPSSEDFA